VQLVIFPSSYCSHVRGLLIVPAVQRRVKNQRAILNSLSEGDVVLTSAGISTASSPK